ncbi:tautomerase family protein [Burkholderia plantarii]|uniref:4-oxalocrotonate tautomerase n=1 Tax=Burkholderia plantarii TaxID=41899 RepID=A0A0B6RRD3_BURPL|nr:tautomerase family protein [Burkholderia plantarii]AJK45933.1 4-oxalocrotonate tautomerase [Burkholderia plantarii]ALK30187.1 4-oxalocrotonate tautomerase [Burkholderia plantarii]GLZ21971.1 tautomerase family protein [Burkholderia plantarii]
MPLVHLSLIKGKSPAYIRAIGDGVHRALMEAYGAPADDRFQLVHQHERDELIYDPDYLGIHRTDDLVIIQIIAGNWRDTPKKKALFAAIAANLARDPGLRPEDVMITLTPNARDEWSFGNGLASYVKDDDAS